MKSRHFLALNAAVMLCATAALAGGNSGPGIGLNLGVTWGDLQERCANPDVFEGGIQHKPENIKLQCTDSHREFVAAVPGTVDTPASRTVVTAVFADKYHVDASSKEYPIVSKPGSCLRYKEVERTVAIEIPLSCDQVLNIKGDPSDFCASALDTAKGANPKLVEERETGNVIDTCGGGVVPKPIGR